MRRMRIADRGRRLVSAAALAGLLCAGVATAAPVTYRIDPIETRASFEVHFLKLFPIRGEFRRTTGTIVHDAATRSGTVEVAIDATSVESANASAQASARGPEFFHVDKYPSIDFRSQALVYEGERLKAIEGTLTLLGVAQPVTLVVTDSQSDSGQCRASAELIVQRSKFGMKAWSHTLGDQVLIRVEIVAREVSVENSRATEAARDAGVKEAASKEAMSKEAAAKDAAR